MALHISKDNIWVDKKRYDVAECKYYENLTKELLKNKIYEHENENKKVTCNGDATTSMHHSADELSVITKKSSKNKTKVHTPTAAGDNNSSTTNSNEDRVVKSSAKKNKKKNKSQQNAGKNESASNQDESNNSNNIPTKKKNSTAQKRGTSSNNHCTLVSEIAKAREHIKNSLEKMDGITTIGAPAGCTEFVERIAAVEKENAELRKLVENLKNLVLDSQQRIASLEGNKQQPAKVVEPKKSVADDDDGVDLFASDSEDESEDAARVREERLAAYAAKKSKKPALIAKSSLILDVKPWDDETDLKAMETEIRKISSDGLLWGASKFVPVAFGIQKLSISCVVEDEKVSIDWLTEEIEKFEDFVQSVDVAAFNKI